MVTAMTESDRIASAESEIRGVLETAGQPISSTELGDRLTSDTPRSLVRLAVHRMIGRGMITYDAERRYSLGSVHQPQA
jgi:DNA-binding IclR family transcriptional regulator